MIEGFGTDEQKQLFLEKMYSGEWAGTMCLTEPQAGSDVGASKTKAIKLDDGTYLITGEKIFITSGDHDLTENIIHLVLARTPDAPPGTKGLSLFIVPKIWVNEDGSLGEPNDVYCSNIEEKMGIHGSPTCSLVFGQNDGCRGLLLGEEEQGMKLMFHMMNGARIEVGLQGAAVAGAAHQAALAYAKERLQSRHWKECRTRTHRGGDRRAPGRAPDAAHLQGLHRGHARRCSCRPRTTSTWPTSPRARSSEKYQSYVEVLTPICKAWASDMGCSGGALVPAGLRRLRLHIRVPGRAVRARRRDRTASTREPTASRHWTSSPASCRCGRQGHPGAVLMAAGTYEEGQERPGVRGSRRQDLAAPQADRDDGDRADQTARWHAADAAQRGTDPRHGRHHPRRPLPSGPGDPCQGEAGALLEESGVGSDDKRPTRRSSRTTRRPPSSTTRCSPRSTSRSGRFQR